MKYVSPKSGNAVGSSFAGKYEKKLLKLPFFLGGANVINNNENDDICSGFSLTFFFIFCSFWSLKKSETDNKIDLSLI